LENLATLLQISTVGDPYTTSDIVYANTWAHGFQVMEAGPEALLVTLYEIPSDEIFTSYYDNPEALDSLFQTVTFRVQDGELIPADGSSHPNETGPRERALLLSGRREWRGELRSSSLPASSAAWQAGDDRETALRAAGGGSDAVRGAAAGRQRAPRVRTAPSAAPALEVADLVLLAVIPHGDRVVMRSSHCPDDCALDRHPPATAGSCAPTETRASSSRLKAREPSLGSG
jgi:hypothetical protein